MRTKQIDRNILYFECIDSTNIRAGIEAEAGAEHGTVVMADMQTTGRGRRGRVWDSPAGKNLYFTLILKPDFAIDRASMLTLVMAMAVAEGLQRVMEPAMENEQKAGAKCEIGIKWPNDLVINGRKICGILTEMSVEQNRIKHILIGVGVNVKKQEFAPELVDKATDIETECGQRLNRKELLAEIMSAFEEFYETFLGTCDLTALQEAYNELLVNCGREVCVLDPRGEFRGVARGINDSGELLVEREDGSVANVYAGEVSVRGIYGYV